MMKFLVLIAVLVVAQAELAPLMTDNEPIPGAYIVVLEDGEDVDKFASSLELMATTHDVATMEIKHKFSFGLALRKFPDAMVNLLQRMKGVKYVEQDGVVYAQQVPSWGLDRIDQRDLPLDNSYKYTSTGKDIPVWVIDTGINYYHVDLYYGRARSFFDYEGGDGMDCNGHGSHCSGTIGGRAFGVANEALLYSCRSLSCSGVGYKSDSIAALEKITDSKMGPGVVSMSLGGGGSSAQDEAVANCVAAGYVVSVAAGNSNDNACNYSPARAPEAITVGATESNDGRAYYSNYGECLDIFAPGSSITSIGHESTTDIVTLSGTSMACPHVSGAAAKVFSTNPGYTPADVEMAIKNSATLGRVVNPGSGSPNVLLYSN